MAFVDCDAPEERTAVAQEAATSFRNPGQAALVLRTVKGLLTAAELEGGPDDIAVITPYSGQVSTTFFLPAIRIQSWRKSCQCCLG